MMDPFVRRVVRAAGAGLVAVAAAGSLDACGPSVVKPGASFLRGEVSGRRAWTFDCDPPAHVPPGAPMIDLNQQPVTFQCRSQSPGATLALVLHWTNGGYAGSVGGRSQYTSSTSSLQVVLIEATADGMTTTSLAVGQLGMFGSNNLTGHSVSGEFTVSGDVNGQGSFELVAR